MTDNILSQIAIAFQKMLLDLIDEDVAVKAAQQIIDNPKTESNE